MLYAQHKGDLVEPLPDLDDAFCPFCAAKLIPKCGSIRVWHWAHQTCDCDPWSEGETAWHKAWKERFPKPWREVTVGCHRADIKTPGGVLELQHSSISADEIREREEFYGQMVWLFDCLGWPSLHLREGQTFTWKHPRASILSCTKPVFLHVDPDRLINIHAFRQHKPVPEGNLSWRYGYYRPYTVAEFVRLISEGTHEVPAPLTLRSAPPQTAAVPAWIAATREFKQMVIEVEYEKRLQEDEAISRQYRAAALRQRSTCVNHSVSQLGGIIKCSCGAVTRAIAGTGGLSGRTVHLCLREPIIHRRFVTEQHPEAGRF